MIKNNNKTNTNNNKTVNSTNFFAKEFKCIHVYLFGPLENICMRVYVHQSNITWKQSIIFNDDTCLHLDSQ